MCQKCYSREFRETRKSRLTEAQQPLFGEVSANRRQECNACKKPRVIKKDGKCTKCCSQAKPKAEETPKKRRYQNGDRVTTIW